MKPADVDALDAILDSMVVPVAPPRYVTVKMALGRWGGKLTYRAAADRLNKDARLASGIRMVPGAIRPMRCWWPK